MPLLANETKTCTPHFWFINMGNLGVCKKCGETKQYPGLAEMPWEQSFIDRDGKRRANARARKTKEELKEAHVMSRISKSGIEYLDYQWGVFSGCGNHLGDRCGGGGREFNCWAKAMAHRYPHIYPDGFKPHYYPEAIDSPKKLRKSWRVGVGWVGDVIGYGLDYRDPIFDTIMQCPQHKFLFLTKNPDQLADWAPFPVNAWVGVSATNQAMYDEAVYYLASIEASVKFISIEPYLSEIHFPNYKDVDWLILGARTQPYRCPSGESIDKVVQAAKSLGIPLFLKNNLRKGYEIKNWIQEVPE